MDGVGLKYFFCMLYSELQHLPVIRDQAIELVQFRSALTGGTSISEGGYRGGEAFLKTEMKSRAIFERFSKEGSPLFGARRRGGRGII